MLIVHLRINDEATARPTPVWLRVSTAEGHDLAPLGRVERFATGTGQGLGGQVARGKERWYCIDGSCEIRLPSGVPLRIQADKGPEYRSLDTTVSLGAGQMALRFSISRWTDLRSQSWYAGDGRAHSISPHDARAEAEAADLAVVNILAAEEPLPSLNGTVYDSIPNIQAFSGQEPALTGPTSLVSVNTLNVHPVLGRVALLSTHRPVYPLSFGGEESTDDWSICDWCDQGHRKKGLTVWVEPTSKAPGHPLGGETLVAAILGKIDAFEITGSTRHATMALYTSLLNAGIILPLIGSSGKDSNRVDLGSPRTYAQLAPGTEWGYAAWIEAVRAGRTYLTHGPLVEFTVADQGPGGRVPLMGQIPIRAKATSRVPFEKLEILSGRTTVAATTAQPEGDLWSAEITIDHRFDQPTWLAARTSVSTSSPNPRSGFALTSPVVVGEGPISGDPADRQRLREAVNSTLEWVESHGRFTDPRRKARLIEVCHAARDRLEVGPS